MLSECAISACSGEISGEEEPKLNWWCSKPSLCSVAEINCDCEVPSPCKAIPRIKHAFRDVVLKDIPLPERPRASEQAVKESEAVPAPPFEEHPNVENTKAGQRLIGLSKDRPFVAVPGHYLHGSYRDCLRLVRKRNLKTAEVKLNRLELEADLEVRAMTVMFDFFKSPGVDAIRLFELCRALRYLGMPADKSAAFRILDAFDENKEARLDLGEFQFFVGNMGGSVHLFEKRKGVLWAESTPAAPALLGADETYADLANLSEELNMAGFEEDELLYWRLAMPLSESRAVASLKACQKAALLHIRTLARKNHEKALPKLERRMRELGCGKDDMWQILAWIRECAPIIIQLNLDTMMSPMNTDTHYRNQFETSCSGGLMNIKTRRLWERNLFRGAYDQPGVDAFDRVKYGVLNVMYDHRGVARTEMYGDSYIILKDVRLRCTFAPQDSANLTADKLAVIDYFAHDLVEYTDAELKEVIKVATSSEPVVGDSCVVGFLQYKEAQIHGEIALGEHVQRLVAHDRHKTGYAYAFLSDICKKHGIELSWLSDEKSRMSHERSECLSPTGARHKGVRSDPFCVKRGRKNGAGLKAQNGKARSIAIRSI